jgi:hypothetical protein
VAERIEITGNIVVHHPVKPKPKPYNFPLAA